MFKNKHLVELGNEFSKYNKADLLAKIAGLQIYHLNHTQVVRLQLASLVAGTNNKSTDYEINPNKLLQLLNQYLPTNGEFGFYEDPPENLFTDNIEFCENYIVYPGLISGEVFILSKLLRTLFVYEHPELAVLETEIFPKCRLLLEISNLVASKSGHKRYIEASDRWNKDILSDFQQIKNLSGNVRFNKRLIQDLVIRLTQLKDFIFVNEEGNNSEVEIDLNNNPLLIKPFIETEEELILTVPSAITGSLINFIWMTAKKLNLISELNYYYRKTLFQEMFSYFNLMKYQPIKINFSQEKNELYEEAMFLIDKDKLVFASLIVDDASDYDGNISHIWQNDEIELLLSKREKEFNDFIKSSDEFKDFQILFIWLHEGIGRGSMLGGYNNFLSFDASLHDFETIAFSRHLNIDPLTLWKFTSAKKEYKGSIGLPLNSTVDVLACYFDQGYSFYFDDNKPYSLVNIRSGYGQKLRETVKQKNDSHLVIYDEDSTFSVYRDHPDEDIAIYKIRDQKVVSLLVEGANQPVWIKSKFLPADLSEDIVPRYSMILEFLSYWVWQILPGLYHHLKGLYSEYLDIIYSLDNPAAWVRNNEKETFNETVVNLVEKVNANQIELVFSPLLLPGFQRPDNLCERLIIKEILNGFATLQKNNSLPTTLNEKAINEILDKYVPLGTKKKLYIISPFVDPLLIPVTTIPFRPLQSHDIERQLDDVLPGLQIEIPEESIEIIEKEKKVKLLSDTAALFYNKLKTKLANLNYQELLGHLLFMNEACLYESAREKLVIPTTLKCFEKNPSVIKEIFDAKGKLPTTNLALRSLIEIIAAEPPKGNKLPSLTEIDELLALTHNLIHFATMSDHVNLDIFNHRVSILPSGRIGIIKDYFENFWDPFMEAKTQEEIYSFIKQFPEHFEQRTLPEAIEPESQLENTIFPAEFGFKMTQIVDFLAIFFKLGQEVNQSIYKSKLSDIKNIIAEKLKFNEEEINKILDLFSLKEREKWDKAPEGYNGNDIWPWRYNRRLSLNRKPLILIQGKSEKDHVLCWGIRQTASAMNNLLNLIFQGRYKIEHCKSKELKSFIGKVNDEAGTAFNKEVENWFTLNKGSMIIKAEVDIKPGKFFNAPVDLGDIDIFIIDLENFNIYSIECKEINSARSAQEISNELEKFWDGNKPWVEKHIKRHKWLEANFHRVFELINISPNPNFKLISIVLTSVEIPSTFIKTENIGLPFISFTNLEKNGINILKNLRKTFTGIP